MSGAEARRCCFFVDKMSLNPGFKHWIYSFCLIWRGWDSIWLWLNCNRPKEAIWYARDVHERYRVLTYNNIERNLGHSATLLNCLLKLQAMNSAFRSSQQAHDHKPRVSTGVFFGSSWYDYIFSAFEPWTHYPHQLILVSILNHRYWSDVYLT